MLHYQSAYGRVTPQSAVQSFTAAHRSGSPAGPRTQSSLVKAPSAQSPGQGKPNSYLAAQHSQLIQQQTPQ